MQWIEAIGILIVKNTISDWLSGSWTQDHLAVWLENWLVYLLHYSTLTAIKSSKWKTFSFGWVKLIYIVVNYFHASRFESCFFKVKDNWNVLSLSNSNSIPGQNDLICRSHESYKCAYLILNKQQWQCLKVWGRLWIPSLLNKLLQKLPSFLASLGITFLRFMSFLLQNNSIIHSIELKHLM